MFTSARSHLALMVAVTLSLMGIVSLSAVAGAAGKGRNGSTLDLVVLPDSTLTPSTTQETPHWGDDITFAVSTSATDQPFVNVRCFQAEALVFDAWEGFYSAAWSDQTFTLSSSYWQSGEADCTARLIKWGKNGRERTLATLDFHVDA